jgi:hypothetical protein
MTREIRDAFAQTMRRREQGWGLELTGSCRFPEQLHHRGAVHGMEEWVDLLGDEGGQRELACLDQLEDPRGDEGLGAAAI